MGNRPAFSPPIGRLPLGEPKRTLRPTSANGSNRPTNDAGAPYHDWATWAGSRMTGFEQHGDKAAIVTGPSATVSPAALSHKS